MLAKMEMRLQCTEPLASQMSSLFHGALMELLPKEYADYLHETGMHPYSQHLMMKDKNWYWVVTCLNKKAVQIIMHDSLYKTEQIVLKNKELTITITGRSYQEISLKSLMEQFYEQTDSRYIQLHFYTPTAFKQKGRYLFYPDIRCIYQNLMNRYDAASDKESMIDEETLEQLCDNTEIVNYDLKSTRFHLEGVRIPSYIGKITLRLRGTQTMTNFAWMLFRFGEYAGIGIKTAIGMGAVRIVEEGERKR